MSELGHALRETHDLSMACLEEVEKVIVGKRDTLETVLLGILAGGHVLIEDLPGLGKTVLARSFARVLGLEFTRVQFTPDLLPQDVTGAVVLDPREGELTFRPGPIFTQLLLADEINRTPPKTQAALLEAMAEQQVSVDGVSRPLPQPFVVLATENPIEYEGTYPLPEAQLDRFAVRVRVGQLAPEDEIAVVRRHVDGRAEPESLDAVASAAQVLAMRESLQQVEVHDDVLGYVLALVRATREHRQVMVGASPRGTLTLTRLARAAAALAGRDFVVPEDVQRVAVPVLGHRVVLRPETWLQRVGGDDVVTELLERVPTPSTVPTETEAGP